ncbi:MAG: hypothetical protein AABY18_03855 [Candidatus Thermoplasmatota archaeon]
MPWRDPASSIVLVATLLAAGCLGGEPDIGIHVPPLFGIADCTNLEVSGLACTEHDGVVVLTGRVTSGQVADPRWPVGIPVQASSSSIHTWHLKDLVIEGFERGVHVAAIGHCDCTVMLENVTIRGPVEGGQTGFSQVTHFNAYLPGKEDAPEASYVFRDVHVAGMATALDLNLTLNGVEVDGLTIDCVESGIVARYGYGGFTARGIDIQGCSKWGLLLEAVGTSSIEDSRFAGNALAVSESFADAGGLAVRNVTFEGNGVALVTSLSANSLSIPCLEGTATVERSRFVGNGARSAWLDDQGLAAGALLAGPFGVDIQQSVFEGNAPAAVAFVDGDGAATTFNPFACVGDAAENYWGTPNGPWRSDADAPGLRAEFGDAVPVGLKVDPFLTQAP